VFGVSRSGAEQLAVVGLDYRAPSECPERAVFVRELETRTERVRTAEAGSQGLLVVEITGTAAAARGEISFREPGGRVTERSIDGASCKDLVDALALIAVVLVDPDAQREGEDEPAASSPSESAPGQAAAADDGTPDDGTASEAEKVAAVAPPTVERAPSAPTEGAKQPAEPTDRRWRFGVGVGAGIHAGTAPNPPIGIAIDASAELRRRGGFGLALGVSFHRAGSEPVQTEAGDAEFTWVAVRAWACPWHWPAVGQASLAACGSFEGGNLSGRGFNTVGGGVQDSLWLAPGLFGRGEIRPIDAVTITLDGGAAVPLFHTEFYFEPEIEAFQVPYVAPFASLGIRIQAN
jgi:hypothetical protein